MKKILYFYKFGANDSSESSRDSESEDDDDIKAILRKAIAGKQFTDLSLLFFYCQ